MPVRSLPLRPLLVAAVIGLAPQVAMAASEDQHLDFTVLKDGSPIGHHHIDLTRQGDSESVAIKTEILVKVAYVPVYRFEHQGNESWRGGQLVSLHSQTNDDGEHHKVDADASGDHIEVIGDGTDSQANVAIIPASLWNPKLISQSVILNTLTGKQMSVHVEDEGADQVRVRGSMEEAHHFKMTGELQRELWYNNSGVLVQVKFPAKDGSEIRYVLG